MQLPETAYSKDAKGGATTVIVGPAPSLGGRRACGDPGASGPFGGRCGVACSSEPPTCAKHLGGPALGPKVGASYCRQRAAGAPRKSYRVPHEQAADRAPPQGGA